MSLISLEDKVNKLMEAHEIADWVPEKEGFLSIGRETLCRMRTNVEHTDGWRYLQPGKPLAKNGNLIRRNIIWRKSYLMKLFKQS
jgi:hypothetical protein